MRILHAIQELRAGGAERLVVTLAEGARSGGHNVATAAAPGPLADEIDGATFSLPVIGRRPWRVPGAARSLRRAIRAWRPDLVHAHNPGVALAAALATRRGRALPTLVSIHGVPDEDYAPAARLLRLAGLTVVACGPGVASGLSEHGFEVDETIVNGIAPAPPAADREALEREWGFPPGSYLLVAAGRLVPPKNHRLAIEALVHVPGVVLAILGEGPLAGQLKRTGDQLGVANRLVLTGFRADARAVIGAADAVIIPSKSEGLPLVALESLSAGTPIVATAARGLRELLTHEQTALLTASDDATAVADALNRLLSDPELRERLARAGRELAVDYTEEAMVDRYLDLYERLVQRAA